MSANLEKDLNFSLDGYMAKTSTEKEKATVVLSRSP
jgi:hypothetical protein